MMPTRQCHTKPDRDDFLTECSAAAAARSRMYGETMDGTLPLPTDDPSYPDNVPCLPLPSQINQVRALYGALGALMFIEDTCDTCDGLVPLDAPDWIGSRNAEDVIGGVQGMVFLDKTDSGTWRAGTGGASGVLGDCDIVIAEHVSELATYRSTFSWIVQVPLDNLTDDDSGCATCFSGERTEPVECMDGIAEDKIVRKLTGWSWPKDVSPLDCTGLRGPMNVGGWWDFHKDVGWYMSYWCCIGEDEGGTYFYANGIDSTGGDQLVKVRIDACVVVTADPPHGGNPFDRIIPCDAVGTEYPASVSGGPNCWKVEWDAGTEPAELSAITELCTDSGCSADYCKFPPDRPGCDVQYACEAFSYNHLEEVCCTIYGHISEGD